MINVPTEMLRTLVAVFDYKSFTKAAMSLGYSARRQRADQTAAIRPRGRLVDKDVAGVVLTASGDAVVTYARRMLSINDQIVKITGHANRAKSPSLG